MKTSRQTSNNSSIANSNYGSKRFPTNYNLDVNELYESILQTQRSQLSGKNKKKFNNSQRFANLREITQNQQAPLVHAGFKDRFKFQLSENDYEQNSLQSKKIQDARQSHENTFLSSLKTTLNSFLKLNAGDSESVAGPERRRNTSSHQHGQNQQFSSTEGVLLVKSTNHNDIRLDSIVT